MGRWRITIEGVGGHHNGERAEDAGDADHAAKQFVNELRHKGQSVTKAEFEVTASPEDLL